MGQVTKPCTLSEFLKTTIFWKAYLPIGLFKSGCLHKSRRWNKRGGRFFKMTASMGVKISKCSNNVEFQIVTWIIRNKTVNRTNFVRFLLATVIIITFKLVRRQQTFRALVQGETHFKMLGFFYEIGVN